LQAVTGQKVYKMNNSGLYFKHIMIVNDTTSRVISE
jgi:hypothetical protein